VWDINAKDTNDSSTGYNFEDELFRLEDSETYAWVKTRRTPHNDNCEVQHSNADPTQSERDEYIVFYNQRKGMLYMCAIQKKHGSGRRKLKQIASFGALSNIRSLCCVGNVIAAMCDDQVCVLICVQMLASIHEYIYACALWNIRSLCCVGNVVAATCEDQVCVLICV
jgi:hypothetical protein